MADFANSLDRLYSHYLLRDLVGKVLPGFIFLGAVALTYSDLTNILSYMEKISAWLWIMLFGLAWVLAFIIQSFAETTNLIIYHPKDISLQEWYEKHVCFQDNSSPIDKQVVERFIVIKEACGNFYVSYSLSLAILIINELDKILIKNSTNFSFFTNNFHYLILSVFIIIFSRRMHFVSVDRQYKYILSVLDKG